MEKSLVLVFLNIIVSLWFAKRAARLPTQTASPRPPPHLFSNMDRSLRCLYLLSSFTILIPLVGRAVLQVNAFSRPSLLSLSASIVVLREFSIVVSASHTT